MKVLFLGNPDSAILAYLRTTSADVAQLADRIKSEAADVLVSHGYRHILRQATLDRFETAVNLHISFLPWNRGADPNFWSWLEDTPKGVTIHHIDAGVDTGDIIARREVAFDDRDWTLATSYALLQGAMLDLFRAVWPSVAAGTAPRVPQEPGGSFHRVADRAAYDLLLPAGWDTPVADVRRLGMLR